jgi:predicted RNA-binding Zn ribbon-like protein
VISLRLVGGHPALDLVNTVEPRVPGAAPERDHLGTPAELLAWAVRATVVDPSFALPDGVPTLHAVLDIRESFYSVLMSRLDPATAMLLDPGAAAERLMLRWSAAAARSGLVPDPAGETAARIDVGTVPAHALPDRLVHAAVEFLRTVPLSDVRVCPLIDGGCGWLFLDRSRNHSRRWCAMADCGARVKARRLTDRRRAATG